MLYGRLLSLLPPTTQVAALRAQVLGGCSQRHTHDRHIRGNGRRRVTDSEARVAETL